MTVSHTADAEHRTVPTPASEAASLATLKQDASILAPLLAEKPHLKFFTRSSEKFHPLVATWQQDLEDSTPLALARPTTYQDISDILHFAVANEIQICVRAGGHDAWGRSRVKNTLVIDLRELDSITLSSSKDTVTIGGGVIAGNLFKFLDQHDLVVTAGGCTDVGYTNWAMIGGYSFMSGAHGLGVDQIVGATVVDSEGILREADQERLWGLRGAGGNFGIVVSLEVKVHKQGKILAGLIAYPYQDAKELVSKYAGLLLEDHPNEYSGDFGYGILPGVGKGIFIFFVWQGQDYAAGRQYLDRILAIREPIMNTVTETRLTTFVHTFNPPYGINARLRSAYVKALNPGFIDLWMQRADAVPDDSNCFSLLHFGHGKSSESNEASCFSTREDHILVEILGMTTPEGDRQAAYRWTDDTFRAFKASPEVLKGGYLSLMGTDEPAIDAYGENWEKLQQLKKKLDPKNVFRFATPALLAPGP